MTLSLPPQMIIRCDAPTAQHVHDQLTSVIAGHAQATTTYQFYEELDRWLGPWGQQGYPVAYGKFYNLAFTRNARLMANQLARDWVWRTTIALQEALRDYLVGRVRDGTLPSLTEAQLRQAAFDSHPAAYDAGGLAMLTLLAPELMPVVATIPAREFSPRSENFGPTIVQVLVTVARVVPQVVGNGAGALAGPAHTGMFGRAVQQDQRAMLNQLALSRELAGVRTAIESGQVDSIHALDQVIGQLNGRAFPDQGFAAAARGVVQAAQTRRRRLAGELSTLLSESPPVRARVQAAFPDALRAGER